MKILKGEGSTHLTGTLFDRAMYRKGSKKGGGADPILKRRIKKRATDKRLRAKKNSGSSKRASKKAWSSTNPWKNRTDIGEAKGSVKQKIKKSSKRRPGNGSTTAKGINKTGSYGKKKIRKQQRATRQRGTPEKKN